MYEIDARDSIVELTEFPQCDSGAPLPSVIATDWDLFLTYIIADRENRWNEVLSSRDPEEEYVERRATVRFHRVYSNMFGMPNDEALAGHPLWARGLRQYGVYQVEQSSWVRRLERMNSVHEKHNREEYMRLRHYIFTFHDTTFECVARSCELAGVRYGSQRRILSEIVSSL